MVLNSVAEILEKAALGCDIARYEISMWLKRTSDRKQDVLNRVHRYLSLTVAIIILLITASNILEYEVYQGIITNSAGVYITKIIIMVYVDFVMLIWYLTILVRMRSNDKVKV